VVCSVPSLDVGTSIMDREKHPRALSWELPNTEKVLHCSCSGKCGKCHRLDYWVFYVAYSKYRFYCVYFYSFIVFWDPWTIFCIFISHWIYKLVSFSGDKWQSIFSLTSPWMLQFGSGIFPKGHVLKAWSPAWHCWEVMRTLRGRA
jgi:hypothetical protein